MFTAQTQTPRINPDEFSRCEERKQMTTGYGKSLSLIEKTDQAIKESIYHALWRDDLLRALEYYEIDVYVKNGTIYLNGHIVSAISQRRIETAIATIPGILGIKNNLVLDDKLILEIATSLGELERTYDCKFFTGVSHGVVSLNGIVGDENVRLLAEQCAANNPNVRGVVNNVRVSGAEPRLHGQPFWQPTIGETIYFVDGLFGHVKQVIINPNNRCVIQMVIQGQFTCQKQDLRSLTIHPAHMPEKTIVVPVNLIRYLTNNSGFLTIKSTETTRYKDFNPSDFSAPKTGWALPYPYCPEDVLFMVDAAEIENQIMVDPDLEQLTASAQPTSSKGPETPVDILAAWEDDGGQIIQIAEVVA